jgi:hypothetical protein
MITAANFSAANKKGGGILLPPRILLKEGGETDEQVNQRHCDDERQVRYQLQLLLCCGDAPER